MRWISCRPGFFLPVRVLSRLFRRLFLEKLREAFAAGKLAFFGAVARLADAGVFTRCLTELRRVEWVVYAKRPFAGPAAVLAYLGRYTHRVAIANSRLVALADGRVSFRWRDYRHHRQEQADDAGGRRIHPALPAARATGRVPSHPPLRLPQQPMARRKARTVPHSARRR